MKEEKIQYYEGTYADEFPIGPHFRDKYNKLPSHVRYDYTFDCIKLLDYLTNNKYLELLATYEVLGNSKNAGVIKIFSSKQHQEFILKIENVKGEKECWVSIYYAKINFVQPLIDEIQEFKLEGLNKKVGLIVRDEFGLTLQKFDITRDPISIDKNYNNDFKDISKKIVQKLNEKEGKGIILLHGKPGTGKTTYIRHLTGVVEKEIIFLPNNMVDVLATPEFIPFMMKYPESILIIEDAEKVVRSRDGGGNETSVSNLLNMSDGILGDCLKTQIVATFNTDRQLIDKALLRKGRLIVEYMFGDLCVDKTNKLFKALGIKYKPNKSMPLSDIYNYEDNLGIDNNKKTKIGF